MSSITLRGGMRPGTIAAFAMTDPPAGWIECNGAAVSRALYAGLFQAIGELYGAGDGTTTFNLPDMRGEFLRGHDAGRGADSGRVFGASQGDSFRRHDHSGVLGKSTSGRRRVTSFLEIGDDTLHATGNNTTDKTYKKGGDETRPRNLAMLFCVKF